MTHIKHTSTRAAEKEEVPALEFLFHPRSIAVVGASPEPAKQGFKYVELLRDFGFRGAIYPVNPRGGEILGIKVYRSLRDIPSPVDYVISTIPAPALFPLLDECAAKGVKAIQLFTARLGETGKEELRQQERELVERAHRYGIRLLGPNCMGIYCPEEHLSFRLNFPREAGAAAFISQSAGHAAQVVYRSALRGVRFSKVISYGNAADLNETDFIHYFAQDPETRLIGAYLEGVRGGQRFFEVLQEAAQTKPVIILKGGRSQAGMKAAASHTGSLAIPATVWDALCRQSGVIQADSVEELVDLLVAFTFLPPPRGHQVGVLGGGGGGSVATADECSAMGLEVSPLPPEVLAELREILPDEWDLLGNPIDISVVSTGKKGASALPPVIQLIILSPRFPLVIVDVGAEWLLERPEGREGVHQGLTTVIESSKRVNKPVAVILHPGDCPEEWRWRAVMEEQQRCIDAGLAVYPSITRAAKALGKFVRYYNGTVTSPQPRTEDKPLPRVGHTEAEEQ